MLANVPKARGKGRRRLTLRVGEADSQCDSLGLALTHISRRVPHPAAVRTDVGRELHLGHNYKRVKMRLVGLFGSRENQNGDCNVP